MNPAGVFEQNSNHQFNEIDNIKDDIINIEEENITAEESVVLSDAFPDYRNWIEEEEVEEFTHNEYKKYTKIDKLKQYKKSIIKNSAPIEKALTAEEAGNCLTRIAQVTEGFNYAFIQIDAILKDLTNIDIIPNFKYLSYINVSYNYLNLKALDSLKDLPHLLLIYADYNLVDSLHLAPMPYLKVLTLNSNKVSSLSGLKQSSLKCLSLNDNNISQLICESDNNSSFKDNYFNGIDCPELIALSICSNNLININNISQVSINLSVLYLSRNKIQNLKGLEDLINLERLHLRSNHITKLDGFNEKMKKLKYLNIRENRIDNIKELKKLKCLSFLKILVVKSNNFNDNNENTNNRMNILNMLPWLKRLDKDEFTKNEKDNIEYEETDDAYSNIETDSSIGNEEELIFEDQDF